LVENPKEALGQLGVQVPEEVEIKVVEESVDVIYLVLPVNTDELADEQMDNVAAGFSCFVDVPFLCVCVAVEPPKLF